MSQILAFAVALMTMVMPVNQNLSDLLPPNGTPNGWSRDGAYSTYSSSNLNEHLGSSATTFVSNGLREMILQYYRKDSMEVKVEIFDMGSSANAEAVFTVMTTGKTIEYDLGQGTVVELRNILFYTKNYLINISSEAESEELVQTMSILAMTIDAYLF